LKKEVKILVVDDEQDICFLTKSILKKNGYANVLIANSVEKASELIDTHKFEILFIDLSLGDGTGIDVVEYIENTYLNSPLMNIITGFCSIDDRNRLAALGIQSIITKPLTKEKILNSFQTNR
jgi:DNA-binding NtrC family response regulator